MQGSKYFATYPALVGQALARRRELAGLDQGAVAARLNVSQSTWSRVENGESPLTIDLLHKAAKELQTSPSEILEEAEIASEKFSQDGISVIPERSKSQKKDGTALLVGATLAALFIAAINKK